MGVGEGIGWGPATVLSTSPLIIVRSTLNGRLKLQQQYAMDKNEIDFTITMKLTNTSGATLTNVRLQRWIDVDVPVGDGNDDWSSSSKSRAYFFENNGIVLDVPSTAAASSMHLFEPPRLSRRLHHLRGWSNGNTSEVFSGSSGAGGAPGAGAAA